MSELAKLLGMLLEAILNAPDRKAAAKRAYAAARHRAVVTAVKKAGKAAK